MPNNPLILLLLLTIVHGGLTITPDAHSSLGDVIISDGVDDHIQDPPPLVLPFFATTEESCEPTYGFVPCTTTIIGNIFLIVVYGYFMILAAQCLSTGSETLLKILGPRIVGGLFLPVLGALPDALLILVSGLSGSTEHAQYKISVGMGLLAGTTITLLTMVWGSCVVAGKCDLRLRRDSDAIANKDTKGFSLTDYGISTDILTSYTARIMAISTIPFIIVQIPQVLHSATGRHLAVLISLIVSLLLWISYCFYQVHVRNSWIPKRRIECATHRHVISGILRHINMGELGRLLRDDGNVNREVLERVFNSIDVNTDGKLSAAELKALIIGIHFEEIDLNWNDDVEKVMKEFDTSRNDSIELDEFVKGIEKWLKEGPSRWTKFKAVLMSLLGTIIAFAFADPLIDAVDNFSTATSIPSFFISFIALPLVTNISEWVSTVTCAGKKEKETALSSFSEIYGAVTMNNLLCLSVFSALVYVRGLTWDFSGEVVVIVFVCIVMGAFASFRTTFPLWTSLVAVLLYPSSLALIYVLDYVLGWS